MSDFAFLESPILYYLWWYFSAFVPKFKLCKCICLLNREWSLALLFSNNITFIKKCKVSYNLGRIWWYFLQNWSWQAIYRPVYDGHYCHVCPVYPRNWQKLNGSSKVNKIPKDCWMGRLSFLTSSCGSLQSCH